MSYPDDYDPDEVPSVNVPSPAVQVNVSVSDITLDTVIGGHIDTDTLGDKVAELLVKHVVTSRGDYWTGLEGRIRAVREDEIRAQLAPLIAERLALPFPKVNGYGEPAGGVTSLAEVIMAEVQKVLSRPLDSYSKSQTILQKLVADAVQQEFSKVITDQVRAVRQEIANVAAKSAEAAVMAALRR